VPNANTTSVSKKTRKINVFFPLGVAWPSFVSQFRVENVESYCPNGSTCPSTSFWSLSRFVHFSTSAKTILTAPTIAPARQMNPRHDRDNIPNVAAIADVDVVDNERLEKKKKVKVERGDILEQLDHEGKNVIILSMYDDAVRSLNASGRQRFREDEKVELMSRINSTARVAIPSWRALMDRISRMEENGGTERKPGSGRRTKWNDEIEEEAKARLRAAGGEISKQLLFEEVISVKRPKFMCRATFFRHMASKKKFKNRRLRLKPYLTEAQMGDRVEHANFILGLDERTRRQIVYVDEKLFLAFVPSTLTLPAEDKTPEKFGVSKTNQPKVMTLVCVMEPRGAFSGHVGLHLFVERVKADRSSKNREAGVMELKIVNVTAEEYLHAWEETLLPRLKELIDQKIMQCSAESPLLLQDDNAKPHRGSINGSRVTKLICDAALTKFQFYMKPLDPKQPAQSPDCNPLDTFFFRAMYMHFRQARAEDRVLRALQGGRRNVDEEVGGVDSEEDEQDAQDVDLGDEGDFLHRRVKKRVPLRCHAQSDRQTWRCPHCQKTVKENDDATQCDFRTSWWHNKCANDCLEMYRVEMSGRGVDPTTVAVEDCWWCPHCAYHFCRNEDAKKNLCVICEKPSARADRPGTDMVTCDSAFGGLFHKSCVEYDVNDVEEEDEVHWLCPICDCYLDDGVGADELAQIDEVPLSLNNVEGISSAIHHAFRKVDRDTLEKGFETRLAFLRAIRDANGTNSYEKHWRPHKKRG
jgi:hypothetical protein